MTTKFTHSFLAEQRELLKKATPGPWGAEYCNGIKVHACNPYDIDMPLTETDARLIASMRNNWSDALEEIEAQKKRIEQLETRLNIAVKIAPNRTKEDFDWNILDRIDQLETVLNRLRSWARAYPLDVFPEPDFIKVRELLAAGGITIDAVSASNMRHVIYEVQKMISKVLPEEKEEAK